MKYRDIKPGYVYHIKDMYFDVVKDDKLMQRFKEIRRLYGRGIKMVFPNIMRLEKLMLDELASETENK